MGGGGVPPPWPLRASPHSPTAHLKEKGPRLAQQCRSVLVCGRRGETPRSPPSTPLDNDAELRPAPSSAPPVDSRLRHIDERSCRSGPAAAALPHRLSCSGSAVAGVVASAARRLVVPMALTMARRPLVTFPLARRPVVVLPPRRFVPSRVVVARALVVGASLIVARRSVLVPSERRVIVVALSPASRWRRSCEPRRRRWCSGHSRPDLA